MTTHPMKLWLNGALHEVHEPIFPANDRGPSLGDGLFETIRIREAQPCHLQDHWGRLCASAAALQIALPYDLSTMNTALHSLAKTNAIVEGAARLVLTRGSGARGLAIPVPANPHMLITMTAYTRPHSAPPVLGLSHIRRNTGSFACRHKTLSYIDNIAARLHQSSTRQREDVIMLDNDNQIASASAANLFWWDGQCLHTPALNGAILPGTMRARILHLARQQGIPQREDHYTPEALLNAQSAYITNALIGMQPLAGLDFGDKGHTVFDQPTTSVLWQNAFTDL